MNVRGGGANTFRSAKGRDGRRWTRFDGHLFGKVVPVFEKRIMWGKRILSTKPFSRDKS